MLVREQGSGVAAARFFSIVDFGWLDARFCAAALDRRGGGWRCVVVSSPPVLKKVLV